MRENVVLSIMVMLASAGCGSEDDGPPRVEAEVSYAGTTSGTLVLAAFSTKPPMGPPLGVAQAAAPVFPENVVLELPAGTMVYLLAMLDVPPASPQQPGPEDRTVWSDALTVGEGATSIRLTIAP